MGNKELVFKKEVSNEWLIKRGLGVPEDEEEPHDMQVTLMVDEECCECEDCEFDFDWENMRAVQDLCDKHIVDEVNFNDYR